MTECFFPHIYEMIFFIGIAEVTEEVCLVEMSS